MDAKAVVMPIFDLTKDQCELVGVRRMGKNWQKNYSNDKTYKFKIAGKSGTEVTVQKNTQSNPTYITFASAGATHEIEIFVGDSKVSSNLYIKAE